MAHADCTHCNKTIKTIYARERKHSAKYHICSTASKPAGDKKKNWDNVGLQCSGPSQSVNASRFFLFFFRNIVQIQILIYIYMNTHTYTISL
jgi:hypothetical protein